MKKWWIGCSGFFYKGWRGKFYPDKLPQRMWFEYYCQFFNTVELNVTFYRFPRLPELQAWYDRSPQDFKFTCKAPRLITHFKKFLASGRYAQDFYQTINEGLRSKLGPVLFQLHPGMEYSAQNLDRILTTLDPAFRNVVEFRHPSWWNGKVREILKENNITFCGISYPDLPDEVMRTSSCLYYRFHGVPKRYLSSYPETKLQMVASKLKAARKADEVYCYFNNDIEVAAVANARRLNEIVGITLRQPPRNEGANAGIDKSSAPFIAE